MSITVTCGQCQQTLRVGTEHAGKKGKCPKCQSIIPIPAANGNQKTGVSRTAAPPTPTSAVAAATPSSAAARVAALPPKQVGAAQKRPGAAGALSAEQLQARVLRGFSGAPLKRVRPTPLYQLGILLTTVLMVALPLVYFAIIGLVGALVSWHLTHSHVIFSSVRGGRAGLFALVIYVAPLVIGAIVIVFMFKPLFARSAHTGRTRSLTRTSDPLLFEFVERICTLVGAAAPRRIDIDCDINAAASFRRGWLSLITGRDLVLTIGMPLAAGLSLQQFRGVLAHEFGHFSQGAGMRLTYIIRSINFWFVRVVYQRDAWDEWLESVGDELDIRIGWIIYVARGCVWLTRRILWALMYVGHLAAGFMLRQMEFDADKYKTRLSGSESFAATSRQLRLLNLAWQASQQDLASFHRDGRLVDDLPRLLMAKMKQLPKEAHAFIDKMTEEGASSWFDTHPSDKERIAAASAENASGVFQSDLPARAVFGNFEAASKGATWDYYCSALGQMIDPKSLQATDQLVARIEQQEAAAGARDRFFAGTFTPLRPLRLPVMHGAKTQHTKIWHAELTDARQTMESLAAEGRDALEQYDKADTQFLQARQARALLGANVSLQTGQFETAFKSAPDASRVRDAALGQMNRLGNRLQLLEDAAGRRLRAALMLLFDPGTATRVQDAAACQEECRRLLTLVSQIGNLHASIFELRNNNAVLAGLLSHIQGNERNETLIREVLDHAARVRRQIGELRSSFERVDYPFDHAAGQLSVASYLIRVIPLEEQIGAVYEAAGEVVGKLVELYSRAVSRLCVIAEAVEAAQGLSPLAAEPAVAS